jgi:hypothetical protein
MKNEHDTVFHVQHVVERRHLKDDVKVLTSNNYFVTQDLQNRDDDDPNRQTAKPPGPLPHTSRQNGRRDDDNGGGLAVVVVVVVVAVIDVLMCGGRG